MPKRSIPDHRPMRKATPPRGEWTSYRHGPSAAQMSSAPPGGRPSSDEKFSNPVQGSFSFLTRTRERRRGPTRCTSTPVEISTQLWQQDGPSPRAVEEPCERLGTTDDVTIRNGDGDGDQRVPSRDQKLGCLRAAPRARSLTTQFEDFSRPLSTREWFRIEPSGLPGPGIERSQSAPAFDR